MRLKTILPELYFLLYTLKKTGLYQKIAQKKWQKIVNTTKKYQYQNVNLFLQDEKWDSKLFDLKVGKVESLKGNKRKQIQLLLKDFLKKTEKDYLIFRLSHYHLSWIQELEQIGAITLDNNIDMSLNLKSVKNKIQNNKNNIISAKNKHLPELLSCAKAFHIGRFFTDPKIKCGSKAYSEWIKNSLFKKAADHTFLYQKSKKIQGLITVKKDKIGPLNVLKIPLIAKHPHSEIKNIGQPLLNHVLSYAKNKNIDLILINTQSANIPAQRAYLKFGFLPYHTSTTLRILK